MQPVLERVKLKEEVIPAIFDTLFKRGMMANKRYLSYILSRVLKIEDMI